MLGVQKEKHQQQQVKHLCDHSRANSQGHPGPSYLSAPMTHENWTALQAAASSSRLSLAEDQLRTNSCSAPSAAASPPKMKEGRVVLPQRGMSSQRLALQSSCFPAHCVGKRGILTPAKLLCLVCHTCPSCLSLLRLNSPTPTVPLQALLVFFHVSGFLFARVGEE